MSDNKKEATANLEFFKSAILEPALKDQQTYVDDADSTVSDFGVMETAHWASLGVRIGYFDGREAQDTLLSSGGIFKAWINMRSRGIISPDDDWGRVVKLSQSGQPVLNERLFPLHGERTDSLTAELLQDAFQTFLLLTAENIFDDGSHYFLSSIGWTDEREWKARKEGMELRRNGSAQHIGSGFANVLHYWEEIDFWSRSPKGRRGAVHPVLDLGAEGVNIGDSRSPIASSALASIFIGDTRTILARRFNLGKLEIVDRYFVLAGELANRGNDGSAEWLDARLTIFERLALLITYAGGGANIRNRRDQLWSIFTQGAEIQRENTKPVESRWKARE